MFLKGGEIMTQQGVYQLWAVNDKAECRIGSFKTLSRLQTAWTKNIKHGSLQARVYTGDSYSIINDQMPVPVLREYSTALERDSAIEKEAAYFTIVRFLGVGQYERHEMPTKEEAVALAEALSKKVRGNYMIYAVNERGNQAYISTVLYKR